jgi:multidrug efflux pump subunit AcrA (membrane-fusion protein)
MTYNKPSSLELKALELRIGGASYRDIAEELRLPGAKEAFRMVDRASHLHLVSGDKYWEKQLDIERLDELYKYWLPRAKEEIKAARLVLQIVARRARIFGYDNVNINIGQFENKIRSLAQQHQLDPDLAVAEAINILHESKQSNE